MTITTKRAILGISALTILVLPLLALAHPGINMGATPFPYWAPAGDPLLSCSGPPTSGNSCKDLCQLIHTASHIIYFMMTLAVFVFAPILIVIGGIMVMVGGASPSRIDAGKKILWGTLIGVALALGAYLIVDLVYKYVIGGGFGNISCDPTKGIWGR